MTDKQMMEYADRAMELGRKQGRADAIDECINKFKQRNCIDTKCKIRECSKCIVYMLMEQLKEHKNADSK